MSAPTLTRPPVAVNAADLKNAVAWAAKSISRRPTQPILAGLRLDNTPDGTLAISGFDNETHSTITVRSDGDPWAESLLVHGATLADMTERLTGTVTLEADEHSLALSAGRTSFSLHLMPTGDYPPLPTPAPTTGTLDAADLTRLIGGAAICAAKASSNHLEKLKAIRVFTRDDQLHVIATDRYRAAHLTHPWTGKGVDVLAPLALPHAIRGAAGPVQLGADEHRLTVQANDRSATLSLVADIYPNVEQLWSPGDRIAITADRADLIDAIRTAAVSIQGPEPIRFDFDDEDLTLAAGAAPGAVSARGVSTTQVDTTPIGRPVTTHLTHALLTDLLTAITTDRVHLSFDAIKGGHAPIVIRPTTTDDAPVAHTSYLLQPLRKAENR